MLKARLIFPLSELQCRKVLLLSEKCNKRSDFYCLKIKNIPEGLRLAGISESPEPKLGSKWGQSAGFGSWGCSSPAARHFRAPNLLAKHPKKKKNLLQVDLPRAPCCSGGGQEWHECAFLLGEKSHPDSFQESTSRQNVKFGVTQRNNLEKEFIHSIHWHLRDGKPEHTGRCSGHK